MIKPGTEYITNNRKFASLTALLIVKSYSHSSERTACSDASSNLIRATPVVEIRSGSHAKRIVMSLLAVATNVPVDKNHVSLCDGVLRNSATRISPV